MRPPPTQNNPSEETPIRTDTNIQLHTIAQVFSPWIRKLRSVLPFLIPSDISPELFIVNFLFINVTKKSLTSAGDADLVQTTRDARKGFKTLLFVPLETKQRISNQIIGDVQCCWYEPPDARPKTDGVLVCFHGGAYVAGSPESCIPYMSRLCNGTNLHGISVGYSLAPEELLPAAIEDGFTVFEYLMNEEGIPSKKIALLGDSAGASLVILMALQVKIDDRCSGQQAGCVVSMSAWDVPSEGESYRTNNASDAFLDERCGILWGEIAVGVRDKNGNLNPDVPPQRKYERDVSYLTLAKELEDLENFPPVFMSASAGEVCVDDTVRFGKKLEEIGKNAASLSGEEESVSSSKISLHVLPNNGLHVIEYFAEFVPEASQVIDKEVEFLTASLGL